MRLLEVTMRNFKQSRKAQTLKLANRGLVGIFGDNRDDPSLVYNGVGKTMIPDAIMWCFTGFTTSGNRGPNAAKGDDVVNEVIGKNCMVRILAEEDGVVWRITRYRKDHTHRNRLFLQAADTDHTQHTNDETQERVTRLLGGLDYDALMTAMVFGQGVTRPFSLMSPKEQEEVLDTISGANLVRRMVDVIRSRKSGVREELADAQRDFDRVRASIADLKAEVKDLKREQKRAEKARNKERKALATETREARKRLGEAVKAAEKRVKMQNEIDEQRAEVATRRDTHDAHLADYREKRRDEESIVARVRDLKGKLKATGGKCPACGSTITADRIPKMLEKELSRLAVVRIALRSSAMSEQLRASRKREAEIVLNKLVAQRDKIPGIDLRAAKRLYAEAQRRYKRFHEQKDTHQTLINKHTDKLATLAKEQRETTRVLRRLKQRMAHLEWCEKQCTTNIPLDIHESVVPFLNTTTKVVSEILTDGAVPVTFATEKKNKNGTVREGLSVESPNAFGSKLYKLQSRAERQRIDIIIAAAFQALGTEMSKANLNVRFFDEPFDGLDPEATERVVTFLRREQQRCESVFVITHSEYLRPVFTNEVKVTKHHGVATITDTQE